MGCYKRLSGKVRGCLQPKFGCIVLKKKAPNGIVGLNNDESPRFKEVPDH